MARKRRAPNYTGALAKPIYLEDDYKFTGGLGQATQEPDVAAMSKRAVEKFWLLFKHYKIDPSDEQSWLKLGMSLALGDDRTEIKLLSDEATTREASCAGLGTSPASAL